MIAAVSAARAGAQVSVLERLKKPGKKLLLTGNGRCNITNLDPELKDRYHSVSGSSVEPLMTENAFSTFGVQQTLALFEELGLMFREKDGYVYPRSGQAKSVLNALISELERLHVRLKYDTEVTGLEYDEESRKWLVKTEGWQYQADAVILCCGSKAGIADKGNAGYDLAASLGHTIIPPLPALTALHSADRDLILCDGARANGRAALLDGGILPFLCRAGSGSVSESAEGNPLFCGILPLNGAGRSFAEEAGLVIDQQTGELQFISDELSGIPVFQLSRYAYGLTKDHPLVLGIDFLPEYEEDEIRTRLESLLDLYSGKVSLHRILGGFVHERIAAYLLRKSGWHDHETDGKKREIAGDLAALLKRLALIVDGTRDFSQAQICAGGAALYEVDEKTLESVICPGVFFAGEMLDIDGPCGGYNLQWAWTSGYTAGKSAAEKARES